MKKSTRIGKSESRETKEKIQIDQELLGLRKLLPSMEKSNGRENDLNIDEIKTFLDRTISINGLVVRVQEDLYRMITDCGVEVLNILLEQDRDRLVGSRYKHQEDREASRYGYTQGKVVCGGRKVKIRRPRVRSGTKEIPLPTYQMYAKDDPLNERILKQILLGVATRKYKKSLEEMGQSVQSSSTSKSSVSRRYVHLSLSRLQEKLAKPIDEDIVALILDGIRIKDHTIVVALGVNSGGEKNVLGLREGSTENATVCRALLQDLIQRGLPADKRFLVIVDGGKGLNKAIREVFGDRAVVQRCQQHKKRNVMEHLSFSKRAFVRKIMNEAYGGKDFAKSKKILLRLAKNLEEQCPSAASSIREGLDETLTVIKLGLPDALRRSFSSANLIESMLSTVRDVQKNVKRWRSGKMILRWTCMGAIEAEKKFRRVKGYKQIPVLVNALMNYNEIADVA